MLSEVLDMGLNKFKLSEFIEVSDLRNTDKSLTEDDVVGLSTQKQMIKTKADLEGVNLGTYKVLKPGYFAYVPDTSRRGDKMSMAYNDTENTFIVSSISIVFYVKEPEKLDPIYLFMYFKRPEFDRYARFNSWGSARETFDWKTMCDITIELPPIDIQRKFAEVYLSMVENQKSYEAGLEDLKLTCDGYIENLKNDISKEPIGEYLILSEKRNDIGLGVDTVRGLAVSKQMIPTKADMDGVSLSSYKVVPPRHIAYVSDTSRRGDKMSLGYNDTEETLLVSSISTVFTTDTNYLLPEYLLLFFCRSEFDRYARFHSWGSARETFDWKTMCEVKIPIPEKEKQKAISEIFQAYTLRKEINEQLKTQIKDICPILIKGSLEEARA